MRILVASDIHGRLHRMEAFNVWIDKLNPERIILLGDYLYNGPRNGVPDDYNPMEVSKLLNMNAQRIIGVRGNCDSRIDDTLLDFKLEDNRSIELDGMKFELYHGDDFSLRNLKKEKGHILLSGHTHIYVLKEEDGIVYLNPGSISFPKNMNPPSFALIEDGEAQIIDFDNGSVLKKLPILS
ncbi:MAG: phosphodiesterase [Bacilli bacterium]|jgi:putative phosphoesterase|nr:phosphodiesterase [Bacilli bacterium]MCH4210313.1 phosphodiesterase [Bacilli bacterium]MCH4228966.1 phosphodiesterase [Bacilli bacterium]MCH4278405.1 phosphodiesterase [Bacilli bacterium]MCI2054803.1 phosphodiesterase [Bacilli bacterium]